MPLRPKLGLHINAKFVIAGEYRSVLFSLLGPVLDGTVRCIQYSLKRTREAAIHVNFDLAENPEDHNRDHDQQKARRNDHAAVVLSRLKHIPFAVPLPYL